MASKGKGTAIIFNEVQLAFKLAANKVIKM
jgi:hypothetical protein